MGRAPGPTARRRLSESTNRFPRSRLVVKSDSTGTSEPAPRGREDEIAKAVGDEAALPDLDSHRQMRVVAQDEVRACLHVPSRARPV